MKKIALTMLFCAIPAGLCAQQSKLLDLEIKEDSRPLPPAQVSAEIIPVIAPSPAKAGNTAAAKKRAALKAQAAKPRAAANEGIMLVLPKENTSSQLLSPELVAAAGIPQAAIQSGGFVVGRMYTVVKGDTLWDLSGKYYKDPFQWGRIYNANYRTVADPDRIHPREELIIPDLNDIVVPFRRSETAAAAEEAAPAAAPVRDPGKASGVRKSEVRKPALSEPGEILEDFDRNLVSEEMPEHQKEWSDGMKVVPDTWNGDGEITAKLKNGGDSMDESFSLAGEAVEISMDRSGMVKPGDYLAVYLKGGDVYDKSGVMLGRELQPAGLAEVESVDGSLVKARVVNATTAISKGYLVKKK